MHLDGIHPAVALDDRGIVQDGDEPGGVGRRRHRHDPEVGADRAGHIGQQRQAEIGRQVAFVDLVEDHEADPWQLRIVLQPSSQDALGDDFDPGVGADVAFVAGLIADGVADALADQVGHAPSGRSCGEATRLEHHDSLLGQPWLIEQRDRDHGGLAGTRGSDEHGAP